MKLFAYVAIFVLGGSATFGQTSGETVHKVPFGTEKPASPEEWRLKLVTRLMTLPSPLHNGAVQLHGMGDEAAVDVIKALASEPSLTVAEQQTVLDIVHMSFEQTASIVELVHRQPLATLFLLQYLGSVASDATTKQRVTEELVFVRSTAPPTASGAIK